MHVEKHIYLYEVNYIGQSLTDYGKILMLEIN